MSFVNKDIEDDIHPVDLQKVLTSYKDSNFLEDMLKEYNSGYNFDFQEAAVKEECESIKQLCEQISKECKEFAPVLQNFHKSKSKIEKNTESVKVKVVEIKNQVN